MHGITEQFAADDLAMIKVLLPEEISGRPEAIKVGVNTETETTLRGYRVMVIKRAVSSEHRERGLRQLQKFTAG